MSPVLAAQTETLVLWAEITKILFVFAYGACVGSLTNVLVYRLPRGMGVVVPSSACPNCHHTLSWRDNIPVLGWLVLRGRCRYCRNPISPEYPLVEFLVGMLFVVFYVLWYGLGELPGPLSGTTLLLGLDLGQIQPEWASNGLARTWPLFVMLLILVGSLVAMTIVDAKTFMIPLVLAWTPAIVGVAGHLGQYLLEANARRGWMWTPDWSYAIATPGRTGWPWVGVAVGGILGIALSLLLMKLGLLKRSFADYDDWEAAERAKRGLPPLEPLTPAEAPAADAVDRDAPAPDTSTASDSPGQAESAADPDPSLEASPAPWSASIRLATRRWLIIAAAVIALAAVGGLVASLLNLVPAVGALIGALLGPIPGGLIANRLAPVPDEPDPDESHAESPTDLWLEYPHARREMFRELLFVGPAIVLALLGASIAWNLGGPWTTDPVGFTPVPTDIVPRWLEILSGSLLGYLIGGGVVWGVRILGSLLFRKEAMGLGDVHLMAGVGACLGWIDPTLAFFLAAPIGLYIELLRRVISGGRRAAMPFGPSLAIAVLIVLLAKPWLADAMTAWMHRPIRLP